MESWRLEQPPNPSTRCCPHLVRFTSQPPSRGEPHFDFAESSTTTQPRPCSCVGTGRHRICAHARAPRGPRASLAPFRGLLPFTANGLFIIWVGALSASPPKLNKACIPVWPPCCGIAARSLTLGPVGTYFQTTTSPAAAWRKKSKMCSDRDENFALADAAR